MSEREYHLKEFEERGKHSYLDPFLSPLAIGDQSVFVDLGCGSGYVNAHLAARKRLRHNIGLEFDFNTLCLADEANAAQTSIQWICASAEFIPLPAESVDAIVCRVVLPLVNVSRVVAEIGRILKPGGKTVLALHDWSFYLRWFSLDPRKWKRSAAGLLHLLLGLWFNLTGRQFRPRFKGHPIGQTFQTEFRMRQLLGQHNMQVFHVVRRPEFLVYALKNKNIHYTD